VSRFPPSRKPPRNTSPTRHKKPEPESLKKVREAIERLFVRFCTKRGYRLLKHLTVDGIREFRNSLVKRCAASTTGTRLGYVRSFLGFCQASGWMPATPAVAVKAPRSHSSPTVPFEEAEVEK
jgi:site-specific recombinase XerD